jgi:hypothetical protein
VNLSAKETALRGTLTSLGSVSSYSGGSTAPTLRRRQHAGRSFDCRDRRQPQLS